MVNLRLAFGKEAGVPFPRWSERAFLADVASRRLPSCRPVERLVAQSLCQRLETELVAAVRSDSRVSRRLSAAEARSPAEARLAFELSGDASQADATERLMESCAKSADACVSCRTE